MFYKVINPEHSRFNETGKLISKWNDLTDPESSYRLRFSDMKSDASLKANCFFEHELQFIGKG